MLQKLVELLQQRMVSQIELQQSKIELQLRRVLLQITLTLRYQIERKLLRLSLIELRPQSRLFKLRLVV